MIKERRLHPRAVIVGFATLTFGEDTAAVNLMNISPQGVQVEMTQTVMTMLASNRGEDGTWPKTLLQFGANDPDPILAGSSVNCELMFSRRVSQNAYVAGFTFVKPDRLLTEAIQGIIKGSLV